MLWWHHILGVWSRVTESLGPCFTDVEEESLLVESPRVSLSTSHMKEVLPRFQGKISSANIPHPCRRCSRDRNVLLIYLLAGVPLGPAGLPWLPLTLSTCLYQCGDVQWHECLWMSTNLGQVASLWSDGLKWSVYCPVHRVTFMNTLIRFVLAGTSSHDWGQGSPSDRLLCGGRADRQVHAPGAGPVRDQVRRAEGAHHRPGRYQQVGGGSSPRGIHLHQHHLQRSASQPEPRQPEEPRAVPVLPEESREVASHRHWVSQQFMFVVVILPYSRASVEVASLFVYTSCESLV